MKIDYRKLNASFFFIGIATIFAVSLLNSAVMDRPCRSFAFIICLSALFVAVALITAYFARNSVRDKTGVDKWGTIFVVVLFSAFVSVSAVSGVNYSVPVRSYVQTYHISDRYVTATRHGGSDFYCVVNFDGKPRDILVCEDTYNDPSSLIRLERTRGILGVEYVAEYMGD